MARVTSLVRAVEHGGLTLLTVQTPDLTLAFLPQLGGRLVSVRSRGREFLWHDPRLLDDALHPVRGGDGWVRRALDVDPTGDAGATMGDWLNPGGAKTWPAPQGVGAGHWAGPPDAVLDGGEFSVEVVEEPGVVEVVLTSAADAASGLTVTRTFRVPARGGSFVQTSQFTNVSDRDVRWSVWEVVQVDSSPGPDAEGDGGRGEVVVGTEREDRGVDLVEGTGPVARSTADGSTTVPVQDVVAKLGFRHADGAVGFTRGGRTLRITGQALAMTSDPEAAGEHPDGGCRVELWLQHPVAAPLPQFGGLHPDAHYVELELLGPVVTLAPGRSTALHLQWSV